MTPRTGFGTRRAAAGLVALAALGIVAVAGCDPRTLAYFLSDESEISAPGPSLKGKKVVFVTTAAPAAVSSSESIDREINSEVVNLVRARVKKIEIVEPQKVKTWLEAHPTWSDPGEVAKAFEADMAIVFEIQSFTIEDSRSPGMLEGNSAVHIRVFELAHPKNSKGKANTSAPKESTKVYEEDYSTTFPKNAPMSLDTVSRTMFKSKFVKLVATELSWQFLGHDHRDTVEDTRFR